jgi:hypothetical protein
VHCGSGSAADTCYPSMMRKIRICSLHAARLRGVAWINLLPKGAISVGLSSQPTTVGEIVSAVEGVEERFDLRDRYPPDALKDPHFTYHAPNYFHLRADGHPVLLRALVWTKHEAHTDCSPWLRMVSAPVSMLKPRTKRDNKHGIWPLPLLTEDCSLGLHIDFVNAEPTGQRGDQSIDRFFNWGGVTLRVRATKLPPQAAQVGYLISG